MYGSRFHPSVHGLPDAHHGPLHPQSAGQGLALEMLVLRGLRGSSGGQVLLQRGSCLLQERFRQVSERLRRGYGMRLSTSAVPRVAQV